MFDFAAKGILYWAMVRHRGFTVTSSTPQVTMHDSANSFPNYEPYVIVLFVIPTCGIKCAIFYWIYR
jgi:hypothetical protein